MVHSTIVGQERDDGYTPLQRQLLLIAAGASEKRMALAFVWRDLVRLIAESLVVISADNALHITPPGILKIIELGLGGVTAPGDRGIGRLS